MKRSIQQLALTATLTLTTLLTAATASADMKFSFNNEELTKVIEVYAQGASQKIVVDPSVRGKVTILGSDSVTKEEAFNLLSSALAVNGFAISNQGDTLIVQPARAVARGQMEVTTTLPAAKPERLVTYVVALKNASAMDINRTMRFLPSKDGEMSPDERTNSMVLVDWASNMQRLDQILKIADQRVDSKTTKLVDDNRKAFFKTHPQSQTQMQKPEMRDRPANVKGKMHGPNRADQHPDQHADQNADQPEADAPSQNSPPTVNPNHVSAEPAATSSPTKTN